MAHEVESMFYLGNVPWHGLGIKLETPPTIEEAIEEAGLNWRVDRKPLVIQGTDIQVPSYATVRDSDQSVLGVVGKTYRVLQNETAFKWFQPFLDSGEVELHTAGSLRNGRHVWILARVKGGDAEIVKGDTIEQYILLSHSHDGTCAIRAGFTGIRVVCANTVAAAHSAKDSKLIKIRHSENAELALSKVRQSLDVGRREFAATAQGMREMAATGCDIKTLKAYIREVFAPEVTLSTATEQNSTVERLCEKIVPLFEDGRGAQLPGVKGTLWGGYNSVTEFLTWERGRSADTRLENLWFGPAGNLAQRAYDVALKMAA